MLPRQHLLSDAQHCARTHTHRQQEGLRRTLLSQSSIVCPTVAKFSQWDGTRDGLEVPLVAPAFPASPVLKLEQQQLTFPVPYVPPVQHFVCSFRNRQRESACQLPKVVAFRAAYDQAAKPRPSRHCLIPKFTRQDRTGQTIPRSNHHHVLPSKPTVFSRRNLPHNLPSPC